MPSIYDAAGHFTGYRTPEPLTLRYSFVWFIFASNGRGSDTGFQISWDTTSGKNISVEIKQNES